MLTQFAQEVIEAVRPEALSLQWGDDAMARIVDRVFQAVRLGCSSGSGAKFAAEVDALEGEIVAACSKLRAARCKRRNGPRGFDAYLEARWAVDDADHVPKEKCIRKENHAELIVQAALHGVFDEMKCEPRYINVKRYLNQHPDLRMVDRRVRSDGERFRCDIIERKPDTTEKADA